MFISKSLLAIKKYRLDTISVNTVLSQGNHNYDNLLITNNSVLTLNCNLTTGIGSTIICNNLTIDSGSSISSASKGFSWDSGPGKGGYYGGLSYVGSAGGGHGGVGGNGYYATGGIVYGSQTQPITLGSGAGSSGKYSGGVGGGAIKIIAQGLVTINGFITCDGGSQPADAGGGAGGSIWILANSLLGNGYLTAIGGNGGGYSGGGGGGRISLQYRDQNSFSGQSLVAGGYAYAQTGAVGTTNIQKV